ncbi:hypothetical protein [Desulfogranum mediterraneum]|nr:hypothetical protein [Desulfogranum mediterraneum]
MQGQYSLIGTARGDEIDPYSSLPHILETLALTKATVAHRVL